jgi:hypothetical protein
MTYGRLVHEITLICTMNFLCLFLVYTQLVTVAVYAYFLAALFGRQFIKPTL